MHKLLGALGILAGATAVVTYKIIKGMKEDVEQHVAAMLQPRNTEETEEELYEEQEEEKASYATTSYPYLEEADILRLNEISEAMFDKLDKEDDDRTERPLQHIVYFEDAANMEKYKAEVIQEGFVVTNGDENELIVLNITKTNPDAILEKVFQLANIANKYNGQYVRWNLK